MHLDRGAHQTIDITVRPFDVFWLVLFYGKSILLQDMSQYDSLSC